MTDDYKRGLVTGLAMQPLVVVDTEALINNLLTDYEYISDLSVRCNGVIYTVEKDSATGLITKISDSNGNSFEPTINSGITDVALHNAVFWAVAMCRGFGKKIYGNTNIFDMSNVVNGVWENSGNGYDIILSDTTVITEEGINIRQNVKLPITGDLYDFTEFVVVKRDANVTDNNWHVAFGQNGEISPRIDLSIRYLNWAVGSGASGGALLTSISSDNYAVLTIRKKDKLGEFYINNQYIGKYDGYATPIYGYWFIDPGYFWFKYIATIPRAMTDAEITAKIAELMTTYGIGEPEFVADGIFGMFTPDTRDIANSRWRNSITGYNDMTLTGGSVSENAVHFTASQYGTFICDEPNTVYAIVKSEQSEDVNCIITKKLTVLDGSINYGFNLLQYSGQMYFSAAANDILQPEETALPNTEYHCYCYTRSGKTTKFYVDGVFIGSSGDCSTSRYGGLMYLNNELFDSTILDKPTVCDFVMCAFGSQYHDDATVQKNMAYLMKKYGL